MPSIHFVSRRLSARSLAGVIIGVLAFGIAADVHAAPPRAYRPESVNILVGDWIALSPDGDDLDGVHKLTFLQASATKHRETTRVQLEPLFGNRIGLKWSSIPQPSSVWCHDGGHFCLSSGGRSFHIVLDGPSEGVLFVEGKEVVWNLRRIGRAPKKYDGAWIGWPSAGERMPLTIDRVRGRITFGVTSVDGEPTAGNGEQTVARFYWLRGRLPAVLLVGESNGRSVPDPEWYDARPVRNGLLLVARGDANRVVLSRNEVPDWAQRDHAIGTPKVRSVPDQARRCVEQTARNESMASTLAGELASGAISDKASLRQAMAKIPSVAQTRITILDATPLRLRVWTETGPAAGDAWEVDSGGIRHVLRVCEGGRQ